MGSLGVFEILLIFLAFPILYIWSIIWAYRDAESLGTNGILVAILVAVAAWPLSILVWLFIRPKAEQA